MNIMDNKGEEAVGLKASLLQLRQQCGRGVTSSYWRATYDGKDVLVKVINTRRNLGNAAAGRNAGADARQAPEEGLFERILLLDAQKTMQLMHRNIVRCFGVVQLPVQGSGASAPPAGLAMVLEACEPTTLRELLTRSMASGRRTYKLKQAVDWLLQVASALEHLHSRKPPVIHRDLQPGGILLKRESTGELTCRLADLGMHHEAAGAGAGAAGAGAATTDGPSAGSSSAAAARAKAVAVLATKAQASGVCGEIEEEAVIRENPYFGQQDDDPSKRSSCCTAVGLTIKATAPPPALALATAATGAAATTSSATGAAATASSATTASETITSTSAPPSSSAAPGTTTGSAPMAVAESGERKSGGRDTTALAAEAETAGPPEQQQQQQQHLQHQQGQQHKQKEEGPEEGPGAGPVGDQKSSREEGHGHNGGIAGASPTLVAAAKAAGLTADSVGWYRDSLASHSLGAQSELEGEEPLWAPQAAGAAAAAAGAGAGAQKGGRRGPAAAAGGADAMLSVLLSDHPDSMPDPAAALAALRQLVEDLGWPELRPLSNMDMEWFYELQGTAGSFMYMAPEVYRTKTHNEKSDVFSFGVLAYELLAGELLVVSIFNTGRAAKMGVRTPQGYAALVAEGYRPPRIHKLSDSAWALLEACWHPDPVERPSMAAVVTELQRISASGMGDDGGGGGSGGPTRGSAAAQQSPAGGGGASGSGSGSGSGGGSQCVIC